MKAAIALINLKNELNSAALVRTAEHFGIRRIFIVGSQNISWKASMNCHKHMLMKHFNDEDSFLVYLKEQKYNLCIAELSDKAINLMKGNLPKNPCFLTGNENIGVSKKLLDSTPYVFKIPNVGLVNCLNTAIAGSILIYKWFESEIG